MQSQTFSRFLATTLLLLAGGGVVFADIVPPPRAPRPQETCAAVRIHSVEKVQVNRENGEVVLAVDGETSSAGWRNAKLRLVEPPSQDRRELQATYEFIACPPERPGDGVTPIAATLPLSPPLANLRRIVVKAQTNDKTLDIDGQPAHP